MTTQLTHLPEQIRNMDLLLLSDWNKYFAYPEIRSFRQMLWHSKNDSVDPYNGLHRVTKRMAGRVYVQISKFFEWLEEQNKENIA